VKAGRDTLVWWALAIGWALFLRFLGSRPPDAIPDGPWVFPGFDKCLHAGFYAMLGLLWARAIAPRRAGIALLIGAGAGLIWGGFDEWMQARSGIREADLYDLAADVVGAAAGGWIAFRTLLFRRRS
jgi:VanZ family protein